MKLILLIALFITGVVICASIAAESTFRQALTTPIAGNPKLLIPKESYINTFPRDAI